MNEWFIIAILALFLLQIAFVRAYPGDLPAVMKQVRRWFKKNKKN